MKKQRRRLHRGGEAAIVCVHVAKQGCPILRADKDEPVIPEDSGWQFSCNSGLPELESEAQVWALEEVLVLEPSLMELMDSRPGTALIRTDAASSWIKGHG